MELTLLVETDEGTVNCNQSDKNKIDVCAEDGGMPILSGERDMGEFKFSTATQSSYPGGVVVRLVSLGNEGAGKGLSTIESCTLVP